MATEREDAVSISINDMLRSCSPLPVGCCIARLPNYFRKENEKAYEPMLIAIGPYHHGKPHLKAMEQHKLRYLQSLVQETRENDVSRYVRLINNLREEARKCYPDPIDLNSDDFVRMMLLDGCFIVQLIRQSLKPELRDKNHFCGDMLRGDMLLVENQLPFFVLWELYAMIEFSADQSVFMGDVFSFFSRMLPGEGKRRSLDYSIREIKHLLHLVHEFWHPASVELGAYLNINKKGPWNFIPCVTELEEAGNIEFQMEGGASMFDLKFKNGTMKIPKLRMYNSLEYILQNLMAFEQFSSHEGLNHVTDYVLLIHCLVKSSKDVAILRQSGIIENMLGNEEEVARMLERLSVPAESFSRDFYYSELLDKVNKYRNGSWNKWIANLKHKYFNSPGAFISFLAAAMLLLFTLVQTVFTILSYTK